MIPCKCGEPTCATAYNIEKVRQFCLNHTLELSRECDPHGGTAPIWALDIAEFIAKQAGVPISLPYVRLYENGPIQDSLSATGLYTLRVDCGDGIEEFGIKCWVVREDAISYPVGNYAVKHDPEFVPLSSPKPADMKGIPDPDRVTSWGDDEFWVRTTESIVADVANHRKMLDEKLKRLRKELADAEKELDVFVNWVCGTANGG